MSQHVTKYETKNGKTRKVKNSAAKPAGKDGAPAGSGVNNNPKQGA